MLRFVVIQTLNSLSYGSLLFMIASGFSLIFGLMRVTNMVHVGFFLMGGYISYWFMQMLGSFAAGILVACLIIGVLGFFVFRFFLFRLHGQPQSQVLLCLGFLWLFDDLMLAISGGMPLQTKTPPPFNVSVSLFGFQFPAYRLFIMAVGLLLIIALELIINKTHIGALIRSGVDDQETSRAMGVNVDLLFVLVYVGGTVLAAFGGALSGPILGMEPSQAFSLLPISLAIVILGGLGNLRGAYFGSMVVALLDNFGKVLIPELSYFTIFLPMAIILVLKPEGLFVKGERRMARNVQKK